MEEFKNDRIVVHVDITPGCLVKISAELSAPAVEDSYQKAIKSVSKEVSLPGFRKGKAPSNLVLKHYTSHIEKEWRDDLLHTSLNEAIQLTGIRPINRNSVRKANLLSYSRNNGAKITCEYETKPKIPFIDLSQIHLHPVEKTAVTPEIIEDAEEQLRLHHATWKQIEERPVKEGDHVVVTVEDIGTNPDNPKLLIEEVGIDVLPGHMGDWMRKLVIGLQPNSSVEGMSENELVPGNHFHHVHSEECGTNCTEETFKPTLCRIKLHSIWHAEKPAFDDALAKKAGVNDVATLRMRIRESLEKEATAFVDRKLWEQLQKILLETYHFDLPNTIVEEELANKRKEGLDRTKIQEDVNNSLRITFLLEAYFEQHQIPINNTDMLNEYMSQMYAVPAGQRIITPEMDPAERDNRLAWLIMTKKVKAHMLAHVGNPSTGHAHSVEPKQIVETSAQ